MNCTAETCISAGMVATVVGGYMTAWILGFGIGKSVAWTRRLFHVA